jgi:hypothetical protein
VEEAVIAVSLGACTMSLARLGFSFSSVDSSALSEVFSFTKVHPVSLGMSLAASAFMAGAGAAALSALSSPIVTMRFCV